MAKKFLTNIDMVQNQLLNAVAQVLGSDPGSPVAGQFWYNSTSGALKYRNASSNIDLTNPVLLNGQAGSYYLARANHSGTQLAATISDFDTQVRTSRLDQMANPTGSVSLNSQKITGLADGTSNTDAASWGQVQSLVQGLDPKGSVRFAVDANINISNPGTSTFDSGTATSGDRLLLLAQSTASQNGPWVFNGSGSALTRPTDFDTSAKASPGSYFFVEEGTNYQDTGYVMTTNGPITLGTTSLAFTQFSTAGSITAGAGLTKTGNTLDVGTASSSRIVVNADNIDLAVSGVSAGQGSLVTVDTYGRATAITELITSNGFAVRGGANTWVNRTIGGTSNRISVANGTGVSGSPVIDIDSAYVGQTSITTLGTIGTGTWQGTAVAVLYGGTGATTAAGARTNLGAVGKYTATIGDGSSTSITIAAGTHLLGATQALQVSVYDATNDNRVETDVSVNHTSGDVVLGFAVAPTTNQYRVVITG